MSEFSERVQIDGKQVNCIQSILHSGARLKAFTIRFTDGSLLQVDCELQNGYAALNVKLRHESEYLARDPDHLNPAEGGNKASDDYW